MGPFAKEQLIWTNNDPAAQAPRTALRARGRRIDSRSWICFLVNRTRFNGDLSGSIAVVTGGSRGLGREIAYVLARRGSRLVLVARTAPTLMATAEKLETDMARLHARTRRQETPSLRLPRAHV